jgi:sugar O-acyltransferase (sialic acid O-acetyltransferase NeuD family)
VNAEGVPLVIIGSGGFGRETLDVVRAHNLAVAAGYPHNSPVAERTYRVLGFLDDGHPDPALLTLQEAEHLGPTDALHDLRGTAFLVSVSNPHDRRRLTRVALHHGLLPEIVIHPTAAIGPSVRIQGGTVICSHVSVGTNVRLGPGSHLNPNCAIGHDSILREFVTVYPGAMVSGNVVLESEVQIGTGASIIQGLAIGARTFVGAGAAVVRDLPPDAIAVGVPARVRH